MPNGVSKNWVRLCGAIDGFKDRYDHWPTKVRLKPVYFKSIKSIFKQEDFIKLQDKLKFIIDDAHIIAEDDDGHAYDYSKEGFPKSKPSLRAKDWLGIKPDHYEDDTIITYE